MSEDVAIAQAADARHARTNVAARRAQTGLTLLLGLVVLLVLTGLGALVYQTVAIRDNQNRTRTLVEAQARQSLALEALLERQRTVDADRQARVSRAVAEVAAANRAALAEQNAQIEALLRRYLGPASPAGTPPGR